MGGSAHQCGPVRVCLHWDEHPCALHAWGNLVCGQRVVSIWRSHQQNEAQCNNPNTMQIFTPGRVIKWVSFLSLCSYTSSSAVASCPDTHGTGRRVTRAATASRTKWGANPTLTPEISPAHTLSPPQFPAPVPFPRRPQAPAVPVWARRGPHHRAAPIGATVGLPQVPIFVILFKSSLFSWSALTAAKPFLRIKTSWLEIYIIYTGWGHKLKPQLLGMLIYRSNTFYNHSVSLFFRLFRCRG